MLKRIKYTLNSIFNIGIEYAHTISEQKRVRLLNQLIFICLTICIIVLVNELFKQDFRGFLFDLAVISPIPLCFYFNKIGWLSFAKRMFVFFVVFLLTSALVFYGRGCGAEYAYLVAVAFTFIFFLERKEVILFNVFIGFCFVITQIYLHYYDPIYPVIHIPNIPLIASLVCQVFIVFAFVAENKIFDENTQKLLNELSDKNTALDSQKKLTDLKNKALLKANKELESFAYATSHDLRSPLRNIVSFIDLFNTTEAHQVSEQGKEYLGFIQNNARQMNQLIDDILTHAALNAEEIIEEVDLNKIIDKVSENVLDINSTQTNIETDKLPVIRANAIKMQLLFQNMIENGLKYNESDFPEVKISIRRTDDMLAIHVCDNGIGINPKYHDRIFQMFKRLHGQTEYKGTGIGLATCKKIVETYNGKIEVKSEEKEGSTFIIYFPKNMEVTNNLTDS